MLGVTRAAARYDGGPVTYHDSCSGLRELGIKQQPRQLLRAMGVEIVEMTEPEICCGFGGTFCVKYPEISVRMASDKARDCAATKAETVLAGDMGCSAEHGGAALAGRPSGEGAPRRGGACGHDRRCAADRAGGFVAGVS